MEKVLLTLILIATPFLIFSQERLEIDESKHYLEYFENGNIKNNSNITLSDFHRTKRLPDSIIGFNSDKYIISKTGSSADISISKDNIGRIVIYATLFKDGDTILLNSLSKRTGRLTVKAYREGRELTEESISYEFDNDFYKQIDIDYEKKGIDNVKIYFSPGDEELFIIEKLKILSLSEHGIEYFEELEKSKEILSSLQKNYKRQSEALKKRYLDQLPLIEKRHAALNKIVYGDAVRILSESQAKSINPFTDEKFIENYNSILIKANEVDNARIDTIAKRFKTNNTSEVVKTFDNILFGGRFSSLINLMGGLFSREVILDTELPRLYIDGSYYKQSRAFDGGKIKRIKLVPVSSEEEKQIIELNSTNSAYKRYVEKIAFIMNEDREVREKLSNEIQEAKKIMKEYEEYLEAVLSPFSELKKGNFMDNNKDIVMSIVTNEVTNFPTRKISFKVFQDYKKESIINFEKFEELKRRYEDCVISIKTHYNLIFEKNPQNRFGHFDELKKLPEEIRTNWNKKQIEIITEYQRKNGVKNILKRAAKPDTNTAIVDD